MHLVYPPKLKWKTKIMQFFFLGGGGGLANKVYYGLCEIGEFGYRMKQPLSESLEIPLDEIFYPWEKSVEWRV